MTEPLPSFVHNLGKTLDGLLEVSSVLRQDIESLVAAYGDDWSSQPLRRMFVRACELGGKSISAEEHVFLSETRVIVGENGATALEHVHIDTLSNLRKV